MAVYTDRPDDKISHEKAEEAADAIHPEQAPQ